ncbi:MAG TPA: T9SS type A sorting domain-containing protein [Flavipsychrobacter sp.]|nr:T9SS type A sorting domain-containing protein [Flavipsychrobacter sp.]
MKLNFKQSIIPTVIALSVCNNPTMAQRIAAGGWHSVVICNDSTVKAFGENATGQLGDGTTTDKNTPVSVSGLTGIIAVSAGGDQLEAHSMALKNDGIVWTWGSNLYGALGNSSTTNTTAPVQAIGLSNVIAISAGGWHSAALKSDGTVWTWGWNADGQLGDGTTVDKTVATQVSGLTGIVSIAAGTYHILALKNDGTVWAWGDNLSGQIGDGSTTDRTSPVQVSGLTGIIKIAAGRFFSLAVKSDGTVWTWGENLYGQLGNGTTTDSPVPVQVSGLTGATPTVATGAFHVIVEKNDNTIWAWGRNTYGNLGDNTVTHRSAPVLVSGTSSVAGIAAGTNFSLLYKDNGTFWGCGRNTSGQLGDGTNLQQNIFSQSANVCPIITTNITTPENSQIEAAVFPNPAADGKFSVRLSGTATSSSEGKLEVYDLLGRKQFEKSLSAKSMNSTFIINLFNQPTGVYLMRISINEQHFTQRLIKK